MRSVITFWQTPIDETAFFEFLSKDDVIVYPMGGYPTEPELAPISLSEHVRERFSTGGLLSLRSLRDEVATYKLDRDGRSVFAINPAKQSVVGYNPGIFKDGTLTVTNVFAFWDMMREGALVNKSDHFRKWGHAIFKRLHERVKLREGALYPTTAAAEDAARNGVKLIES